MIISWYILEQQQKIIIELIVKQMLFVDTHFSITIGMCASWVLYTSFVYLLLFNSVSHGFRIVFEHCFVCVCVFLMKVLINNRFKLEKEDVFQYYLSPFDLVIM